MAKDNNQQQYEEHYAAEEYAVTDPADTAQYTVPHGYYNENGEFVDETSAAYDFADPNSYADGYEDPNAYNDYYQQQQGYDYSNADPNAYNYYYNSQQQQYDDAYNAAYAAQYTAPVTPITSLTPSSAATPPAVPRPTPPVSAPGTKIYYPSQSNPNNPVGPIIITKSGYAGPHTQSQLAAREAEKKSNKKKKSTVRVAGGEVWEDKTLEDWDDNDYRLFAGDLGNEVTEELLFKTFSKYPSLMRTRVVRDNRTMKSKGYGFISFTDPDDFVRAWREMNGKYVGNRPIKLRKSNWKERNMDVKAKKERERFGPYSKHR